jgi:4-amino-4-deoxy-L-arabinose transferase-like glycosyltransferase
VQLEGTAVYFAARFARSLRWSDAFLCGAALGLAVLTKATAYLFAPPLLAAVLLPQARRFTLRTLPMAGAALICAGLLNVPHYARNLQLSGSILGFESAHGDNLFRWRNETIGWKQTASNVLRNVSDQLGARSEKWNRGVYDWTLRAHQWLGIGADDRPPPGPGPDSRRPGTPTTRPMPTTDGTFSSCASPCSFWPGERFARERWRPFSTPWR